jgi:hypothetical protein
MTQEPQTLRVEVRCVGHPPADRVRRACGISDVEVDGQVLRCRVTGSFQPFLEALQGHEVINLRTAADAPPAHDPAGTPVDTPEVEEP